MAYVSPYLTPTEVEACRKSVEIEQRNDVDLKGVERSASTQTAAKRRLDNAVLNLDAVIELQPIQTALDSRYGELIAHYQWGGDLPRMKKHTFEEHIKRAAFLVQGIKARNYKPHGIKHIIELPPKDNPNEWSTEPFDLDKNVGTLKFLLTEGLKLSGRAYNWSETAILSVNYVNSFIELMRLAENPNFTIAVSFLFKSKLVGFIKQLFDVMEPKSYHGQVLVQSLGPITLVSYIELSPDPIVWDAVGQFMATAQIAWISYEDDRITSEVFVLVLQKALTILLPGRLSYRSW